MENKNMPAMPIPYAVDASGDIYGGGNGETGLTKREQFAAMAMQGLLSANAIYGGKTNDRKSLAVDAVAFADALLKELEK